MISAAGLLSNNAELAQGVIEERPESWSLLVDKYKNLIFSIPIKYGFSREDAADIFQEVCLELLREVAKIRDPGALPKWLITVTSHKCFQRMRERQRFVQAPAEEILEGVAADSEDALGVLAECEREQTLREALGRLNDRCRRLVNLLFFEEAPRPYKEVAEILKIATGSIGFIRQRCLRRLRDRILEIEAAYKVAAAPSR